MNNNIYIEDNGKILLPVGFVPTIGQNVIVTCPRCNHEYIVPFGGYITLADESHCIECGYQFSEYIQLSEFFSKSTLNIIFSDDFKDRAKSLEFYCDSVANPYNICNIIGVFRFGGVLRYYDKSMKYVYNNEYNLIFSDDIETLCKIKSDKNIKLDKILIFNHELGEVKHLRNMHININFEFQP